MLMIVISPKSPILEIFIGQDHFLKNSGTQSHTGGPSEVFRIYILGYDWVPLRKIPGTSRIKILRL